MNTKSRNLVFAVHPTSKGFGWVLFEGTHVLSEWGMVSAKASRKTRLLTRFERLLNRHPPSVLVLEQFEPPLARRGERILRLCRAMAQHASTREIEIVIYSRSAISRCFSAVGATTRYEIALAVARDIDILRRRLPPEPKIWVGEDARHALFDAAALAITHYSVRNERAPP